MSAAFDFRKCKRLLLSSLAVSALYRGPRGIRTKGYVNGAAHGAHCTFEIALSGRQCSLLCLCAPFPHGYTVSRGVPDNCTFEIAFSQATMLTLLLVCAFSPRVHSIPRGPLFLKLTTKRHKVTAKIDTLHNASVCKQPPNANLWLGSLPLETDSFAISNGR